jgi:autotransporter-associated beta strand protein
LVGKQPDPGGFVPGAGWCVTGLVSPFLPPGHSNRTNTMKSSFTERPIGSTPYARVALAPVCACVIIALDAHAATLSWSGAGTTGNWNDSANWGFAGTPATGDTLIFSAAQPRLNNTNNIVGLTLNQIRFVGASGGYAIFGNAITITNGIEATNTAGLNVLSNNITLGSPGDFIVDVATGAKFFLGGTLSGSVGLLKIGGGTNTLGGGFNNTYGGTTTITNGLLELDKNGAQAAAVPHDLVIGQGISASTVRNLAGAEIADIGNVTVNRLSTWDLNDHSETISALTLSGGSVTTGTGTLTLGGNVTSVASISTASISGLLPLGGVTRTFSVGSGSASPDLLVSANVSDGGASAGITKTGSGQITLSGANTYTGVTTIDGFVILANDSALGANGSSTNGTVVHANSFLLVQGVDIGNEFLTLSGTADFRSSGTASWAGPITLNGDVFINVFGGTFTNSGAITGPGGVTKGQTGTLIYAGSGPNTYNGDTIINTGVLELSKSVATAGIVNGTLTIGDEIGVADGDVVRERGANQINSSVPITINSTGLLDLNNFSDAIGAITFSGGHLSTGTGTATLTGNVTANANTNNFARIDGIVSMSATRTYNVAQGIFSPDLRVAAAVSGAGGILKIGPGEMSLTSSNAYTGLTTVSDGFLRIEDSFALGSTNSGTIVSNTAVLALLFDIHVGLEPLTLSGPGRSTIFGALSSSFGSNSWDGAITLTSNTTFSVTDTNDFLNLAGAISGTGDVTKIGPGTFIMSGAVANTYSGSTFFNEGTNLLSKSVTDGSIPHDLFVGDGLGTGFSDVVQIVGRPQIATVSDVTIAGTGLLDLNEISEGISTLSGSGRVDLGSTGTGALVLNGNASTTYSGAIVGTGGDVLKNGTGTFTLTGANTYSGLTTIILGTLIVNGSQPFSPIQVAVSGTLGGSGTVGNITNIQGGVVAPGSSPAILTSSNVVFSGATSDFTVELNGTTPGSGYDQLNVRGSVALGGATLNVLPNFSPLDAPSDGAVFTIINNDGADAVSGTFAGLANNAVFTAGGLQFRINYFDIFGNDVYLTLTNVGLGFSSSAITTGNGDGIIEPNECNVVSVIVTNLSANTVSNISATLLSQTPNVSVLQGSSTYFNIPANGRGTNSTPFQISLSPSFVCGENINLLLAVSTSNQGTFSIPLVLTSGAIGAASSFSNLGIKVVPDGATTNSTVTVSGVTAPIAKATVSFNINHSSDSDLDIFLQGPDGTTVELSTDNGGTGNNYGNSCAQRTTFDDAAVTPITSGAAPFFGTFRPEGKLSDFRGKSGADVNGTWSLLITDDTVNAIAGELDCWTLNLFPATCPAGSGTCDLCPNVTINGALGTNSLQMNPRLTRDGTNSVCGVPKVCPGPFPAAGNRGYDAYQFRNGPSNACITVSLTAPLADVFCAAYLNSFNPADFCATYLADAGNSTMGLPAPRIFSFNVAANATFVLVVNVVNPGTSGAYTLDVHGSDCLPELNITQVAATKVALDWTTASAGFALETTNNIAPTGPVWLPVPIVPVVVNSRFFVTNTINSSTQFFRLRKPLP